MSAKYTHDVMATVGTYQKDGEEKKRYIKCGAAFTHEGGNISIKLDAVPVNPEWSGWLSLFEKRDYEPQQQPPQRSHKIGGEQLPGGAGQGGTTADDQDDIPFAPAINI